MPKFPENLSRIAIAIDYDENGYRSLLHSGINDPCLLYSILAVASSHYSKWQKIQDRESLRYLKKALSSLQSRLKDPALVYQESTIVAMLSLMSYEIFNGAAGWAPHYQGVLGWLAARGNCSDLNSFLKTWISMIDTQKALNLGGSTTAEVQRWLESGNSWTSNCNTIDPFFGCSVRLPRLMAAAAKLFDIARMPPGTGPFTFEEINIRAEELQRQVRDTKIECVSEPSLAMSCHSERIDLCAIEDLNHREYFRRMIAAAETFRHAAHIYIYRITHEPEQVPSPEIQKSIDQMFELLATVPDALGPGSNLGWCLTVLGAELDSLDQREYITCRLQGIQTLGMNNPVSGKRVLKRVWTQRDLYRQGFCRIQRWQDIMRDMGEGQILV
ncbi:uncharacterized protein A1O5_04996 [Cladophialophora psammophila CBS 110553]|uniref:Uncharacterized protein n=1 Tax=Cladophialophora psammophila CBS 110553 TaxID=1182543 RepID=W9X6E9_9EURO|nr:uncharacterized protein A1O5_04996 [Cladophialophora psammophila CBS 110553]EXJ72491.1 hypothetical protein A1O5_04996 [Cladophialophora psammophila CBS 110553]